MTRKKSRPQHRENVSPKSANEGGFYKMFWNSMEGNEGNDASAPSPDNVPQNSPTVIVLNDSDDENPYTTYESSGDNSGVPPPIKQELLEDQTSAGETVQDQSDVIQLEETIEDGVPLTLQPTSIVQSSTALCEASINSLPSVAYEKTDSANVDSPEDTDSTKELCPVSQEQSNASENNSLDFECTVVSSESSPSPCVERISSQTQAIQENGHPCRDLAEVSQVCSISSPDNEVENPRNDCSISLGSDPVVNESRCFEEEFPINDRSEDHRGVPPAMSESTGQALEFLKSLLVLPDEEGPASSTLASNSDSSMDIAIVNNDTSNKFPSMNPLQIKREIAESLLLGNSVTLNLSELSQPATCNPLDLVDSGLEAQPVTSNVDSPSVNEPIIANQNESVIGSLHKDKTTTDEFPTFGHVVPSKIKIEPNFIKRSLDLLRNELLALYNNCHVKIAFECKTDNGVAKESDVTSENDEDGTVPCRVMMERLPTPMVRKGYVALGDKRYHTWKSRTIRQRNEEKFLHLKVWRRGRTRLWRECQLAGMDRASYDEQVAYINKHKIIETSSSSEAGSSEDESADTSIDQIYDEMFHGSEVDTSSADESEISELNSDNHTLPPTPEKLQSSNLANLYVSDLAIPKSPIKGKLRGPKSRRYLNAKVVDAPKPTDLDLPLCRDEYVVERNTVHDDLILEGKKTAPLKITIRKTSANKSEDEREKSVESEVDNSGTVSHKPTNKKIKRTFVTKRTYRKPEEPLPSQTNSVAENDTPKTSLHEPPKKRKAPPTLHYIEDNEYDQSLLGRRSHEVENFNLLEKWDIPFEAPTLFRSPRVASRLAQLKTKEAFTRKNYVRQPVPQKTVAACKEVKEVVEMLCSRTVEAMLSPDAVNSSLKIVNSVSSPEPVNLDSEVEKPTEAEEVLPQHIPAKENDAASTESIYEEDMSETYSVAQEETSSNFDTSECGDSPKKGTAISPTTKKKKKPRYGYRKRKPKPKPIHKIIDTSSTDEKIDAVDVIATNILPQVLITPLPSTQVPVVSEGPGQSPQESEDDFIQSKDIEAKSKVESMSQENEELVETSQCRKDGVVIEKPELVSPVRHTRSKQPAASSDNDVGSTRVTRSKQPTVTLDPDVLENFGIRKNNRKFSSERKSGTSEDKYDLVAKSGEQPVKSVQKKKSKAKSFQQESSSHLARPVLKVTKDSDNLNTQVHEVSEGPGEVLESDETLIKQTLPGETPTSYDISVCKELENIEPGKKTQINSTRAIPDSPMSPTPDAAENEVVEPRMTRSKKRMMREGSAYIAVKKSETSNDDTQLAGDSETKLCVKTAESCLTLSDVMVTSEKASTSVTERNSELETVSTVTDQIPFSNCGGFGSHKSSDLTKCSVVLSESEPELITNSSSTKVDDSTLVIAKQISELIHGPDHPANVLTSSLPAGGNSPKLQEAQVKYDLSPKRPTGNMVSPDFTEGSNSPVDPNTSRERQAVLETLNSILKLSSQNKKIADSLTSAGIINPFDKQEASIELKNSSDDEFDSGDAAGDLVVDEDRDFSDDDDNSAELASRIDQIIKDQIKNDNEPCGAKKAKTAKEVNQSTENSKGSSGKRRDSIDERTGLPNDLLQKLRDPRIRSKILSRLEDGDDLTSSDAVTPQVQPSPKDPIDSTKCLASDTPAIRDPRAIRSGTASDPRRCVETPITSPGPVVAPRGVSNDQTDIGRVSNLRPPTTGVQGGANTLTVLSGAAKPPAILRGAANPAAVLRDLANPVGVLRGAVNTTTALRGVITSALTPRGPLLPTPAALLPTIAALRNASPAVQLSPANSRTGVTPPNIELTMAEEVDDDEEEESLKRRPKKQKKEIDTELMYKSPLEDLQSEARPTYGRNPPRRNPKNEWRNFSRNDRGRGDNSEPRPSRWDVRYSDRRPERDNPCYPESRHPYNQDRWETQKINDNINPIQGESHPWKQNWLSEYNAPPEGMMYQEQRLSYMETHLLNIALLPKTTNLSSPPFTKMYTYFNHGNPQILGIAPPTYDPREKASTITMMDPMGQEMIDIVQLPRPTSGLSSEYFNDLPDEFSLEDLISHPYLALSDMMDEEMEIESHGTNIFDDSDEEQKIIRGNIASKRHVNDPRNRSSVLLEKSDNIKTKDSKKFVASDDPLENILHCLPALKEQYAFKKSKVSESDPWGGDSDKPVAPPPPMWTTGKDLGHKDKQSEKTTTGFEENVLKNWRNPSPPKRKKPANKSLSPTQRRSRSKSPLHKPVRKRSWSKSPTRRRSKSRSRSPERWRRSKSRSPYRGSRTPSTRSTTPSRRSRSISPTYRRGRSRSRSHGRSRSRGRSRSPSVEKVRMYKRSRSRSPCYRRRSTSISPSRKRHSRR